MSRSVFLPVRSGEGPESLQRVRNLPITPCKLISVTVRIVSTTRQISSGFQVGQKHTDDRWHSRSSRIVRYIHSAILLNISTILQSISFLEKQLSSSFSTFERRQRMDTDRKGAGLSRRQLSKSGAAAIATSIGTLTPLSAVASAQETHTSFANRTTVQIRINGAERTLELRSRGLCWARFASDYSMQPSDSIGVSLGEHWPDRPD